ncbi:hypothetical protein ZHAS_00005828 [Anopheles sinensis]|uniref:Uncharacterized protein n=1 Tax=Anopheles sinensis TaxID=74873 RepID=A0A084VKF3_ANOSI|nr:hypothetical protein ZHAS_00005817 [Anopheles sinensis]KFB38447.1 hypothetical protein ZHAS_00005828 [Anopheles sinensis]
MVREGRVEASQQNPNGRARLLLSANFNADSVMVLRPKPNQMPEVFYFVFVPGRHLVMAGRSKKKTTCVCLQTITLEIVD